MNLSSGTHLGPYEILASIGAGGMGEVYRAIDTRLRREVAIKISTERFSDRFDREARAVASLNHPNICTVHDVGPNGKVGNRRSPTPVGSMCLSARRSGRPARRRVGRRRSLDPGYGAPNAREIDD
jgi:serine/threonine protein kinase